MRKMIFALGAAALGLLAVSASTPPAAAICYVYCCSSIGGVDCDRLTCLDCAAYPDFQGYQTLAACNAGCPL
jgi:hypothetical protein